MLLDKPYFLTNKKWYIEHEGIPEFLGGRVKRRYTLTDKATQKAIDSYNEYYKLLNSDVDIIIDDVKELDRIKTKDGRIGTVMAIWFDTTGLEVEFDDTAPETETIDISDIEEIIEYFELTKEQMNLLKKI